MVRVQDAEIPPPTRYTKKQVRGRRGDGEEDFEGVTITIIIIVIIIIVVVIIIIIIIILLLLLFHRWILDG